MSKLIPYAEIVKQAAEECPNFKSYNRRYYWIQGYINGYLTRQTSDLREMIDGIEAEIQKINKQR